jgi:hypothetical protein
MSDKTPQNNLYDENFFYDYGANPNYKKLVRLIQDNTYQGGFPMYKTLVYDKPRRWFPFRSVEDFLEREMRVYSFPRCFPFMIASYTLFALSIKQASLMLPVGQYGYTKIRHTPFYKAWGAVGAGAVIVYPMITGYFFYRVMSFSASMFYNRVILQERNWMHEYNKFNLPHGNYNFKDTPLSQDAYIPREHRVEMKKKSLPPPRWFQE